MFEDIPLTSLGYFTLIFSGNILCHGHCFNVFYWHEAFVGVVTRESSLFIPNQVLVFKVIIAAIMETVQ